MTDYFPPGVNMQWTLTILREEMDQIIAACTSFRTVYDAGAMPAHVGEHYLTMRVDVACLATSLINLEATCASILERERG